MECSQVHNGRSLTTVSLYPFAIRTPTVLPPSLSLLGSLPRSLPSWMRYQQAGSNPDTGIRHRDRQTHPLLQQKSHRRMRCQCQLLEGTLSLRVVLWVCSFHWLEVWKENSLDSLQGWGLIELTIPSFPSAVFCLTGFIWGCVCVCVVCVCRMCVCRVCVCRVCMQDMYVQGVQIMAGRLKSEFLYKVKCLVALVPSPQPCCQFHGNRKRSLTVLMHSYKDKLEGS